MTGDIPNLTLSHGYEVLIPGLGVLLVRNGWLVWKGWITAARASEGLTERFVLELVLLIAAVACWR